MCSSISFPLCLSLSLSVFLTLSTHDERQALELTRSEQYVRLPPTKLSVRPVMPVNELTCMYKTKIRSNRCLSNDAHDIYMCARLIDHDVG